jgi:hypothetical protein
VNAQITRDNRSTNDVPVSASSPMVSATSRPRLPKKKLKILYVGVNDDEGSLRLEKEYRAIDASVDRQPKRLKLRAKLAVRPSELQDGLRRHRPDVLHFGGHGTLHGGLVMRDNCGTLSTIPADALRSLFDNVSNEVQLVILNACFSEEQAIVIRDSVGIAIGMCSEISDEAAIAFTEAFYSALAHPSSVQEAFNSGLFAITTLKKDPDGSLPLEGDDEASIPRLWVRSDMNASEIYLITLTGSPEPALVNRTRRIAFTALLLVSVCFAILFGTGLLRQNFVSEYIALVLLGSLVGPFTWGILSTSREVNESSYSIVVKIIASVITPGATIAGGLWLAGTTEFAIKLKFIDEAKQPINVSGILRLEIDDYTVSVIAKNYDLIEFVHLPRHLEGKAASVTLESQAFRLRSMGQKYEVQPGEILSIYVRPILITKVSGTVSFDGARMPGGRISVVGHDCSSDIRDGFFEVPCEGLEAPVKLQVRVPEYYAARVCTRELALKTLTHNEIVLEGCPTIAMTPSTTPPQVCMHSPEELIVREAALVEQNDLSGVVNLFTPYGEVTDELTGKRQPARDRYRAEFEDHRFTKASHANIHSERVSGNIAYYTSSSSGRLVRANGSGSGYDNPRRSDHWVLEEHDGCWWIRELIINAAHKPFP